MKLLILGFDGWKYKLVERWDLEVIRRKTYSKHDVSFFGNLFTPIVLANFLLEENAKKLGFACFKQKIYLASRTLFLEVFP
ncbi:MAG TPA: hypothetical protein ENF42_04155 [Candidatus Bathyarchaeota archaeon]|nr:hypothetical protein [Candidatus Bathyarchaeota archaeon]